MKRVLCAAITLFMAAQYASAAPVTGSVDFSAKAVPGYATIPGHGGKLTGDVVVTGGVANGTLVVQLKDYETGITIRDKHMKEKYLEVAKYPEARLTLKPWTVTATDSDFEGDLSLHGVTKPVKGKARVEGKKLTATMVLKVSEFGIAQPKWAGVGMQDEVTVTVTAQ